MWQVTPLRQPYYVGERNMGRTSLAQSSTEVRATSASYARDSSPDVADPQLVSYWLQADAGNNGLCASLLPTFPHGAPAEDDFVLFSAECGTLPASLLQDIAKLSDQRPELNCFIISLATRELANGLHGSSQLFQQLQEKQWWQQGAFAVVLRSGIAKLAEPLQSVQDVMLVGLLNTQSVWLLDYASEMAMKTSLQDQSPFSYQQFITDYEKITRLSHYIPERKHYRETYLRNGLLQLVQQELNTAGKFSNNVRHAITYFSASFPARNSMEKLMLKQPDIYFLLMKMRKKPGA
ncbi:hypothetical protein QMZ30_18485 [Pantoea sp. EA-12]|nr:hypothetical protein [Pantoea sp. EA-12]